MKLSIDYRNNKAWPSKGGIIIGEYKKSDKKILSDFNFDHIKLTFNQYHAINRSFIFSYAISSESYYNIYTNNKKIESVLPTTERIILNFDDHIRGFNQFLGPHVCNAEIEETNSNHCNEQTEGILGGTNSL